MAAQALHLLSAWVAYVVLGALWIGFAVWSKATDDGHSMCHCAKVLATRLNMTLLLRMVPLSNKMLILACFKGQLLKSGAVLDRRKKSGT